MNTIVLPWEWDSTHNYQVFLAAVGFESRANHVAEFLRPRAKTCTAWGFPDRQEISYQYNWEWYTDNGFKPVVITDAEFRSRCVALFQELTQAEVDVSVLVDISSLSRFRIATIIDIARRAKWRKPARIDFVYCVGAYSPPSEEFIPNRHVAPVLPSFAGWSPEPGEPPMAVVGLGYEQDKALGAVEHVQAAGIWAFFPESTEEKYIKSLEEANAAFLDLIPKSRVLRYNVQKPFDCFVHIEQIVYQGLQRSGVVLFPFGPKIFTVLCLGVACIHPHAAVWRVSPGIGEPASDRAPTDHFTGLTLIFEPVNP
jgi:hypothetical protein